MSTITSSVAAADIATAASVPAAASFDAEKAKCESQLADWVHCASASTPEGKAKIEALSARLQAIDARVAKAAAAKAEAAKGDGAASTAAAPPAPNSVSTLGHVVDAFA